MRRTHIAAASFVAALSLITIAIPVAAQAAPLASEPGVTGAACQPGQGVTVAVSYDSQGKDVDVRCAPAASGTIAAAFTSAGFALDNPSFVTSIDGVSPTAQHPNGWWVLFTSAADGQLGGASGTDWTMASIGANTGPVTTGETYMFCANDDWNVQATPCGTTLTDIAGAAGNTVVTPAVPATTATLANGEMAAAWIGRQLAQDGGVFPSLASPDWGATIDGLFALAAAHVGGDQIAATAAKLYASGAAYIGTPDAMSASWSAVAKMVLALEVAGLDPTVFPTDTGTRDLIADLRGTLNADGSFGSVGTDNIFVHPLAMIALSRTDGAVPAQATAWLQSQQCSDQASPSLGSFGWATACDATMTDPDSTSLAVQAFLAAGLAETDPAVARAETWLVAQQNTAGGFENFGAANSNSTGLAVQALQGSHPEVVQAAQEFIGSLQITCDTVAANGALTAADRGAIAADSPSLTAALGTGLDQAAAERFFRATAQAVFGLGAPGLASLTSTGAEADLPDPACSVPGEPFTLPPDASSATGLVITTGGEAREQGFPLASWTALLLLAAGLCLWRVKVTQ